MSKEAILKYLTEFNAWVKGQEVYVMFSNGEHRLVDSLEDFNEDVKYIVLKDSYFFYRKALAEGKEVQVKECPTDGDGWYTPQSLKEGTHVFDKTFTYRVKPDRPEFKAGDWVRIVGTLPKDIFKLTEKEVKNEEVLLAHFSFSKDKWIPWKPQPGEWVVMTEVNGKAGVYISGFEVYMWNEEDTYDCEPFLGELPSFIKEKI